MRLQVAIKKIGDIFTNPLDARRTLREIQVRFPPALPPTWPLCPPPPPPPTCPALPCPAKRTRGMRQRGGEEVDGVGNALRGPLSCLLGSPGMRQQPRGAQAGAQARAARGWACACLPLQLTFLASGAARAGAGCRDPQPLPRLSYPAFHPLGPWSHLSSPCPQILRHVRGHSNIITLLDLFPPAVGLHDFK